MKKEITKNKTQPKGEMREWEKEFDALFPKDNEVMEIQRGVTTANGFNFIEDKIVKNFISSLLSQKAKEVIEKTIENEILGEGTTQIDRELVKIVLPTRSKFAQRIIKATQREK